MSEAKIKIKNLYKIFGKNPKNAMEHVINGVGKDELLEKHNLRNHPNSFNSDFHSKLKEIIHYDIFFEISCNLNVQSESSDPWKCLWKEAGVGSPNLSVFLLTPVSFLVFKFPLIFN